MQKTIDQVTTREMESAYVMINCELGSESYIIEQLKLISGVVEVRYVFGNYDILVKVLAPNVEYMRDTITFKIRKIPQIYSTTTVMCSKITA